MPPSPLSEARTRRASKRQRSLLREIIAFSREHGYPPTIRELCELCEISSTSVVNHHLNQLLSKGLMTREFTVARGIRITAKGKRVAGVTDPRDELVGLTIGWAHGEVGSADLLEAAREYEGALV